MKYCSKCGSEILDEAVVCVKCGCAIPKTVYQNNTVVEDKADTALIVLCVLFPVVGLILWAIKNSDSPKAARTYGITALIAVGVEIIIGAFIYASIFEFISSII